MAAVTAVALALAARPLRLLALLAPAGLDVGALLAGGLEAFEESLEPLHDAGVVDVLARLLLDVVDEPLGPAAAHQLRELLHAHGLVVAVAVDEGVAVGVVLDR